MNAPHDPVPGPLLVFDLDGTLVESAPDIVATLNFIIQREGLAPLRLADLRPMIGRGSRTLLTRAFAAVGKTLEPERLEALFTAFMARYEAHIADESALYPGVEAALDRLEAAGCSFAVCTNKIEQASIDLLTALGVAGRFKAICGHDTFKAGSDPISKPDPQALLLTIDRAGGDPRRCLMVGDSSTDIETAKAARVPVIAVDFGYSDRPVQDYGPDRVISHFDALWDAASSLGFPWANGASRLDAVRGSA